MRRRVERETIGGPAAAKVLVFCLFEDLFLQTDGTTSAIYTDLDCSEFESYGPYIESAYCLTTTTSRTTNHNWGIYLGTSNTGRTWPTPTLITAVLAANGETVEASYSTVATFGGLKLKAVAGCKNASGSSRESASCSAWLVLVLRT